MNESLGRARVNKRVVLGLRGVARMLKKALIDEQGYFGDDLFRCRGSRGAKWGSAQGKGKGRFLCLVWRRRVPSGAWPGC